MSNVSPLSKTMRSVRSRITNGSSLHLSEVDGRSAPAKRFRDILAAIVSDLGGADMLSEGQRQLARRAAMMSVECEALEAKSVAGGEIDLDTYGALSDRIGRAFHRLGLKRVPRDTGPSLQDIIARHTPPEAP